MAIEYVGVQSCSCPSLCGGSVTVIRPFRGIILLLSFTPHFRNYPLPLPVQALIGSTRKRTGNQVSKYVRTYVYVHILIHTQLENHKTQ